MRRPSRRTFSRSRLLLVTAGALLLSSCGGERSGGARPPREAPTDPPADLVTASEKSGEEIFRRENCGRCHTLFDRPGPEGATGPPPRPGADLLDSRVGPDLGLEGHRHSDEWHYAHLYAPDILIPGSRMPASRHLFQPERGRPVPTRDGRDLVAYVQALGRQRRDVWADWRRREPVIPAPPPADAPLASRGGELYVRHCAPCHGSAGDGGGALAGFFTIRPRDFVAARYRFRSTPAGHPPTDGDLFRVITLGGGIGAAMPAFDWLPERDRWALVVAVKSFSVALRGTGLRAGDMETRRRGEGRPGGPAGGAEGVAAGRRAWNGLGCPSCHGPAGEGMTREEARADWKDAAGAEVPRSGDLTHACALRGGASAQAIERALDFGVGDVMPSYADALPDDVTRDGLVSFVLSLQVDRPGEGPSAGAAAISRRTPGRPSRNRSQGP